MKLKHILILSFATGAMIAMQEYVALFIFATVFATIHYLQQTNNPNWRDLEDNL